MHEMNPLHDDPPDTPLWWRLASVGRLLGLEDRMVIAECEAGRIPIRLQRFGARGLYFANAADVVTYIRSTKGKQA
jgi:hypothetical protein